MKSLSSNQIDEKYAHETEPMQTLSNSQFSIVLYINYFDRKLKFQIKCKRAKNYLQ